MARTPPDKRLQGAIAQLSVDVLLAATKGVAVDQVEPDEFVARCYEIAQAHVEYIDAITAMSNENFRAHA